MPRSLCLFLLCLAHQALAQDGTLVQAPPFTTSSLEFVDVPGSTLRVNLVPNEFALLLWKARLSSTETDPRAAELLLVSANDAGRWGQGTVSDMPAGTHVAWNNMDWHVGSPLDVHARLRSGIDGGTASVDGFEAFALKLGASGALRLQENMVGAPVAIDDTQWVTLASASSPAGAAPTWLVIAQLSTDALTPDGVSARLLVGTQEFPIPFDANPRNRFLTTSVRSFFLATRMTLNVNDVVQLQAIVNPLARGMPMGLTSVVRDVRLLMIPQTLMEPVSVSGAPLGGFTMTGNGALAVSSLAASPRDAGTWELLVFHSLAATDAGFIEHDARIGQRVPFTGAASLVASTPGLETPLVSSWTVRQVESGELGALFFLRASTGFQAWGLNSSRWWFDAGVQVFSFDAGTVDAGTDAGIDAGGADGGIDGGPVLDAGPPDAGLQDAGGSTERHSAQVGCACGSTDWTGLAGLVAMRVLRRRQTAFTRQ